MSVRTQSQATCSGNWWAHQTNPGPLAGGPHRPLADRQHDRLQDPWTNNLRSITLAPVMRALLRKLPALSWAQLSVILFFASNLLLVSPDLMPTLSDLNPHDETKYIDSGRSLARGYTRGFAWSPLSSVVYAPIYLAVQDSADWFSWMATWGRVLLLGLLWFSFYHLGRQFERYFPRWVMPGLMLVGITLTGILSNPSDALFASMSCLAMARLMAYSGGHRRSDLWLGSMFMGLASLSRNDGLFLLPFFVLAAAYLGWRREPRLKLAAAAMVPAAALVVGYVILRGIPGGNFSLGTGNRGYSAYTWSIKTNFQPSSQDLAALLGTADDSSETLATVILRNPEVFLRQVKFNLSSLPEAVLVAYGKRLAAPLFYLGLAGAVALWRRRAYFALILLLIWPIHSVLYLAFYLRSGFLLLDQFVPLTLAAVGACFLARDVSTLLQQLFWSAPLLALAVYGVLDAKLALAVGGIVPFLALWVWWVARGTPQSSSYSASFGLAALFVAGLILRDGYSFPNYPPIGQTPMDRAVGYMAQAVPEGSKVYAYVPLPALAAKMSHVEWPDLSLSIEQGMPLCQTLAEHQVRALYVTPEMIRQQPDFWELMQGADGKCIVRGFVADPGSLQVFLVTGPG